MTAFTYLSAAANTTHQLSAIIDTPFLQNMTWTKLSSSAPLCNAQAYSVNSWNNLMTFFSWTNRSHYTAHKSSHTSMRRPNLHYASPAINKDSITIRSTCYWPTFSKFYHGFKWSNKHFSSAFIFPLMSFPCRKYISINNHLIRYFEEGIIKTLRM